LYFYSCSAYTLHHASTQIKSRARAPATGAARRAEERDGTADTDAGATEPLTDTAAGRVHAPIPDSDSDEEEVNELASSDESSFSLNRKLNHKTGAWNSQERPQQGDLKITLLRS
jgi:hypothetical protein